MIYHESSQCITAPLGSVHCACQTPTWGFGAVQCHNHTILPFSESIFCILGLNAKILGVIQVSLQTHPNVMFNTLRSSLAAVTPPSIAQLWLSHVINRVYKTFIQAEFMDLHKIWIGFTNNPYKKYMIQTKLKNLMSEIWLEPWQYINIINTGLEWKIFNTLQLALSPLKVQGFS